MGMQPKNCPICNGMAALVRLSSDNTYFVACTNDCVEQKSSYKLMVDAINKWDSLSSVIK